MSEEYEVLEDGKVVQADNNEQPNGKKKREKKPKSKARIIIEWVLTGIFAALFVVAAIGQVGAMINKKANYNQNLPYGYGSFVVKTDSMEPKYKVNTAIITHKESGSAILEKFNKPNVSRLVSEEGGIKVYQALWNSDTDEGKKSGYVDITFMDVYTARFLAYDNDLYIQTTVTNVPMTHRLREIHVDENETDNNKKYVFIVAGINTESEHQSAKGQYQAFTARQVLGVVIHSSPALGAFFGFISSPWGLLVFLLVPAFYLVITSVLDIFKTMKDPEEEGAEGEKTSEGKSKAPSSLDSLSEEDKERLKREMLDEMMNKK